LGQASVTVKGELEGRVAAVCGIAVDPLLER